MKRRQLTPEELRAYDEAQFNTSLDMLKNRTGKYGGVMAGSALLALLAPTVASWVDNQEETFLGDMASGLTSLAGVGIGGAIGLKRNTFTPEQVEAMVADEIKRLKTISKTEAKEIGAQAAIDNFARNKQKFIEDLEPITHDSRARSFNRHLERNMGFFLPSGMISDLNIMGRTPRQIAGMSRGALLGSLATALPSYMFLRQGEVES